jgi:hypothetical protein
LRRMFQLLYFDISKADQVLYLSSPSAASSRCVLLPTPTRHPYDVAAGSFQIGGVPFPLIARAARARVERTASRALFLFIVDSRTCIRGFSVGEKEKNAAKRFYFYCFLSFSRHRILN